MHHCILVILVVTQLHSILHYITLHTLYSSNFELCANFATQWTVGVRANVVPRDDFRGRGGALHRLCRGPQKH